MTSAKNINQIKLNLAAKSFAKKIVYLPEPGEFCSCFFMSRLTSESMNVNPQNPRRMANQWSRWRTVFLPPPPLWQSGRRVFPSYLKCTFLSCTAHSASLKCPFLPWPCLQPSRSAPGPPSAVVLSGPHPDPYPSSVDCLVTQEKAELQLCVPRVLCKRLASCSCICHL